MTISNKEIIEKLTSYLMKQDQKTVCRFLANCFIDYNRLANHYKLPEKEKKNLEFRISYNAQVLRNWVKNGCDQDESFKLFNTEDFFYDDIT